MKRFFPLVLFSLVILLSKCKNNDGIASAAPRNVVISVPDSFNVVVVAEQTGRARHIAVNSNGDIYVKLRSPNPKGIMVLRDENNDGVADKREVFGDYEDTGEYGTGMRIYRGYLYFSTAGEVYRIKLTEGEMVPKGKVELIMKDDYKNDPHGYEHIAKPITFDNDGHLYVQFGAPGDMCQLHNRQPGEAGQSPCPQLEDHGGVWQFDANKLNQTQKEAKRYATGIRSIVGMDWNQTNNTLYALQHGRDDLHRTWPALYTPWQSAVLPSEEFLKVTEGSDAGWPYYYYDQFQKKKILNPEYGGDGKKTGEGDKLNQPIVAFPGHWAPNDLLFYTGDQFPDRYKNGAFIAFHGSTIRAPYPQAGYFIGFVPFKDGMPSGEFEVFADGFAGVDTIVNTSDAAYRPMAVAMGPDGSLYVGESEQGKIWKITYKGDKTKFSDQQLVKMEEHKNRPNIKNPEQEGDNLNAGKGGKGSEVYFNYCSTCHQSNGQGDGNRFPPLVESEWVNGSRDRLIGVVLNGLQGEVKVKDKTYNNPMPAHGFLSDEDIAEVLTYIRKTFNNNDNGVTAKEVKAVRDKQAK